MNLSSIDLMANMALLQVGGGGSAPTILMCVAAWAKAIIGTVCAYKTWDELGGQGDFGDKLKRVAPYGAGLAFVATPDILGRLFGVAQGSGLMNILTSWTFTM